MKQIDSNPIGDLITVREAAALMHLTPRAVRYAVASGRLPAVRYAGTRKALIPRAAVVARPVVADRD